MKTSKKPMYIIERTKPEPFNRKAAIEYYNKLKATRYAIAMYIGTVKKQNLISNLRVSSNESRQAIKNLKDRFKAEFNITQYVILKRRFGLGEFVSVEVYGNEYNRKQAIEDLTHKIKRIRQNRKANYDVLSKRTPNWILKQLATRELNETKSPKDNAQYVGIEIECTFPSEYDITKLSSLGKFVNVGSDGSVVAEEGYVPKELRVLVKRTEVRDIIPKLMSILNEMKAKVNRSCGLHVHLDQRNNLDPGTSFTKLIRSLNLLYTVVPKSRRRNQYCQRNRRLDFNVAISGDRYKAVNATAYRRYKTLEVRLFGGTLSAEKIINWIETLHAITEGTLPTRCPRNFDTATNYWALSEANIQWLKARQTQFAALNLTAPNAESDTEDGPDYDESESAYCEHCDEHDTHETDDCEERQAQAV